jgi:hypothetical protein
MYKLEDSIKERLETLMKKRGYDSRLYNLMDTNVFSFYLKHKDNMKVEIGKDNKIIIEYGFKLYTEEQFEDYLANHNYFNKRLTERFIYTDPEN